MKSHQVIILMIMDHPFCFEKFQNITSPTNSRVMCTVDDFELDVSSAQGVDVIKFTKRVIITT